MVTVARREILMLVQLLMGFLADLLFDAVRAGHRSYEVEIDRYLGGEALALRPATDPAS
jgi:hypothetical protein